jgi:hypothetical protein
LLSSSFPLRKSPLQSIGSHWLSPSVSMPYIAYGSPPSAPLFYLEDGGDRLLRNALTYLPNYTISHPISQ